MPSDLPPAAETNPQFEDAAANSFNEDQQRIYDAVTTAIQEVANDQTPRSRAFFMDGPGGSGKTFLYNELIKFIHRRGLNVLATAFTGESYAYLLASKLAQALNDIDNQYTA